MAAKSAEKSRKPKSPHTGQKAFWLRSAFRPTFSAFRPRRFSAFGRRVRDLAATLEASQLAKMPTPCGVGFPAFRLRASRNTEHIERLTNEGRMQTPGVAQVDAAKADGRWARAYSAGRDMTVPDDFVAAVGKNAKANKLFATLNRQNQFAIAFRLGNIKTAATRTKRIDEFVAMLARGETPYPNGKVKGP